MKGVLYYQERRIPSRSDLRSSTSTIDACTETHIDRLYARTGRKIIATTIPPRAACFRKEGAKQSGPGTDTGSRGCNNPTWTSSRSPVMSREERPASCRKLARGPVGPSAKRQNGLSWSLIIPSRFQYACLGALFRTGRKHKKDVLRRYRDMVWLHAERC